MPSSARAHTRRVRILSKSIKTGCRGSWHPFRFHHGEGGSMDVLVTLAAVTLGLGAGVGVARLVLNGVLRFTFGRGRP